MFWTGKKFREMFGAFRVAFGVTFHAAFSKPSRVMPFHALRQAMAPGRAARVLLPAALIVFITSCGGFFISESSLVTLTLSPTALLLQAGATPADTATLTPAGTTAGNQAATDFSSATWKSSNDAVATVATGGVITVAANAAANATATITATDSGVTSNTCTVVLYTGKVPTTPLTVNSQTGATTFAAGTNFQAIATATFPGDTTLSVNGALTPYVSWSTSDSTAATITSTGVVSVISGSPFTVTATATFGAAGSNATLTGTSQEFNNTPVI